jgi:hypothetical protein
VKEPELSSNLSRNHNQMWNCAPEQVKDPRGSVRIDGRTIIMYRQQDVSDRSLTSDWQVKQNVRPGKRELQRREDQLVSKTEQMSTIQAM